MRRRTIFTATGAGALAALTGAPPAFAAAGRDGLTVAPGDSLQAAVDAAPPGRPFTIRLRPGTYRGQVVIPADRPGLTLIGLGRRPADVLVVDDRANGTPNPATGGTWGTSGSASVTISADDVTVRNLTVVNAFDEAAHPEISGHQAVAVLTRGDRLVFARVAFLANQDTLYVNSPAATTISRAYFRDCYVEGDVDFIFGRATAVFDRCRIHSLNRRLGYVTAASTDAGNPHGQLFTHCRFTGDAPAGTVYLGRPWHPGNDPNAIGQTIIRDSWLGAHIRPGTPWSDFGTWPWTEARYAEWCNLGPGAGRGPARPQLTSPHGYDARTFLAGADGWHPRTP
ncbi:pectinesterase family protein [Catenuloplanes atrovinosus]|uniref:Pectinesterase n=1 Tax=Catenuloplanes atrovinosus TaxID=137266 RepID=A0AAE3YJK8_9ACTN|nr:pectinesterase family protein [Catenuloplanes atrovinosus]MDR7274087.1 pectinesterase [Catenuloplanes atrovinosus]